MSSIAGRALILRETAISMAINMAISAGFFLALFGTSAGASSRALAADCLPQSFMVGLMGALMPALMLRRRLVGSPDPGRVAVVRRAIAAALLILLLIGGGAVALAYATGPFFVPNRIAFAGKVGLGGLMAAIVTPWAVARALPLERTATA